MITLKDIDGYCNDKTFLNMSEVREFLLHSFDCSEELENPEQYCTSDLLEIAQWELTNK